MSRIPLPISPDVEAAVLALNNQHAVELSWLEPDRLHVLIGRAFYARRIGELSAFLLAFDERADYDSPNYLWFRERYPRFVYVDASWSTAMRAGKGSPSSSTRISSGMPPGRAKGWSAVR